MTNQNTPSPRAGRDAQQATVGAILDHHERLGQAMADHTLTVAGAADRLSSPAGPRDALVAFCAGEVLPHAAAEEETLYREAAGLPRARLLVRAMIREHAVLRDTVAALEAARTPGEIVGAAGALNALFQAHLEKENDLLLPALVDAGVDLGALLAGMHDILGEPAGHPGSESAAEGGCGCGGCGCGGDASRGSSADASENASVAASGEAGQIAGGELDVRALERPLRHERIFSAFEALRPGTTFVLVNDHDPKHLYQQFAARYPGGFSWDRLEAGPQVWRLRIGRR